MGKYDIAKTVLRREQCSKHDTCETCQSCQAAIVALEQAERYAPLIEAAGKVDKWAVMSWLDEVGPVFSGDVPDHKRTFEAKDQIRALLEALTKEGSYVQ